MTALYPKSHIKNTLNKTIGLSQKLQNILALDYGDIIYDETHNETLEFIQ